jgi:hypothetical protein
LLAGPVGAADLHAHAADELSADAELLLQAAADWAFKR